MNITFSEPMDPAGAAKSGNYIVGIPTKAHGKKSHGLTLSPLAFSVHYNPTNDSVTLSLRKSTKKHVQITIRKTLSAANGLTLSGDDTVYLQ